LGEEVCNRKRTELKKNPNKIKEKKLTILLSLGESGDGEDASRRWGDREKKKDVAKSSRPDM